MATQTTTRLRQSLRDALNNLEEQLDGRTVHYGLTYRDLLGPRDAGDVDAARAVLDLTDTD